MRCSASALCGTTQRKQPSLSCETTSRCLCISSAWWWTVQDPAVDSVPGAAQNSTRWFPLLPNWASINFFICFCLFVCLFCWVSLVQDPLNHYRSSISRHSNRNRCQHHVCAPLHVPLSQPPPLLPHTRSDPSDSESLVTEGAELSTVPCQFF